MKNRIWTISLTICFLLTCLATTGCTENVKEPSVADTFYPSDRKELKDTVNISLEGKEHYR